DTSPSPAAYSLTQAISPCRATNSAAPDTSPCAPNCALFLKTSFRLCVRMKEGTVSSTLNLTRIAAIFFRAVGNAALPLAIPLLIFAQPALQQSQPEAPQVRVPSDVAWTEDTIALASSGDPVRGLVLARRCERCHGTEGF